ncbi:MAG: aminoglycoside phosphotransferase [Actinomycetota bacterium]|nr:aminoglycoside phosphotransferase [Actinomycetota bacterium]
MRNVEHLLPSFLGRQRWFAGPEPEKVVVVDDDEIVPGLQWMVVEADGARYQVVVGLRPADPPPEYLHGHEQAVLGPVEDALAFDATVDPEYAKALLHRLLPDEHVEHVRPMGVEQSNTSLVCDDRLVLKLFRRLPGGPNPDVAVPAALAEAGFAHVAEPLATWAYDDDHLAVVQPFLAGGAEGWALALASLRDLYAAECDPAEAGGDFAAESARLGEITARMHVAMAAAFGVEGEGIRVHGDYHLGQVLRTDVGWFVLDFEGEPLRPLEQRTAPSSPYKDVAGMLRSFHYASQVALLERDESERQPLAVLAEAWEQRNRAAFLDGYHGVDGIDELLPRDRDPQLTAHELEKAEYELAYERAHRPDWEWIPQAAIRRLQQG